MVNCPQDCAQNLLDAVHNALEKHETWPDRSPPQLPYIKSSMKERKPSHAGYRTVARTDDATALFDAIDGDGDGIRILEETLQRKLDAYMLLFRSRGLGFLLFILLGFLLLGGCVAFLVFAEEELRRIRVGPMPDRRRDQKGGK